MIVCIHDVSLYLFYGMIILVSMTVFIFAGVEQRTRKKTVRLGFSFIQLLEISLPESLSKDLRLRTKLKLH